MLNDRQRQKKHYNIGGNVACSIDVELGIVWNTLGLDGGIPEALDGAAHEETDQQLRKSPGADDDDGDDVDLAHVLHGHDTVILEEQGKLGREKGRAVKDNAQPEALHQVRG